MQFDPVDDNLSIPEIGAWGIRKYHFLKRYLDLFSKGMAKKWPERHYIDLFAGAGQSRVRDREELVVTSPLIAATTTVPFSAIHLCDSDPDNCKAMQARILRSGFVGKTHVPVATAIS